MRLTKRERDRIRCERDRVMNRWEGTEWVSNIMRYHIHVHSDRMDTSWIPPDQHRKLHR